MLDTALLYSLDVFTSVNTPSRKQPLVLIIIAVNKVAATDASIFFYRGLFSFVFCSRCFFPYVVITSGKSMVVANVTTVMNIVHCISLDSCYRQPPKSKKILFDIAPPTAQESHWPNRHRLYFIYLIENNLRLYCTDLEFSSVFFSLFFNRFTAYLYLTVDDYSAFGFTLGYEGQWHETWQNVC